MLLSQSTEPEKSRSTHKKRRQEIPRFSLPCFFLLRVCLIVSNSCIDGHTGPCILSLCCVPDAYRQGVVVVQQGCVELVKNVRRSSEETEVFAETLIMHLSIAVVEIAFNPDSQTQKGYIHISAS